MIEIPKVIWVIWIMYSNGEVKINFFEGQQDCEARFEFVHTSPAPIFKGSKATNCIEFIQPEPGEAI